MTGAITLEGRCYSLDQTLCASCGSAVLMVSIGKTSKLYNSITLTPRKVDAQAHACVSKARDGAYDRR